MDENQVQCSPPIPTSNISMKTLSKSLFYLSKLMSHPLFSILTASLLLIILYVPRSLLPILLSPVPICTSFLLYSLFSFGSKPACHHRHPPSAHAKPESKPQTQPKLVPFHQNHIFLESGIEWVPIGGPLEIIYEDYEGEEDGDSSEYSPSPEYSKATGLIGFGSLDFYLTDSDSGSDCGEMRFRWDEDEEDDEGMIEIAFEEDNLIEIDIFCNNRR
ncbi:uncharacterized protein LOC120266775 [Dioscorea cayenensis subsp. rotundata]|uniref:Uncharacterized protein LOC120266775 n=1 Tax=Dioscorea cayennensis subsp. rotundata TaxID=55577 RepID=A0AB40BSE1_DIOCR|nr:uncharacterized protein LOC120266775 [Dioscorea cayenensis subsp. rotundata]